MDLQLTEEQELLRNAAREFLENESTEEYVRAMETDVLGHSPDLWKKMAALGWHGLAVPEAMGGAGFTLLDLAVLTEELGRAILPGPFIPNQVCATALMLAGTKEQQERYLPQIADGTRIHTFAYTEETGDWSEAGVKMLAAAAGENFVLDGTKWFVPDVNAADFLHVAARKPEGGLAWFIVPRNAAGVEVTPLETLAGDRQARVRFTGVTVPAADAVTMEGHGASRHRNLAAVLECAYLVGLVQRDFDISINYAKERVQFGRPIGSFQAIQHKASDMATDVDAMRFITYRAAWAVSEDEESQDFDTAAAKTWCSEASRRVVAHGQQMHGGIGFTRDYVIQMYFRRQKRAELFWGNADYHRERLTELLAI